MSTVLASRNNNNLLHHQSFMGEIPNFSNNNNNLRHLHSNPNPNKNPNPNQKHKSAKRKHFSNGRLNNNNDLHGGGLSQTASDDGYSFNQSNNQRRVDESCGDNYGSYVTYNVAACSRGELVELRRKLVSDLERIRRLNDRIQVGELSANLSAGLNAGARTTNGKFKNLSGNKRMPVGINKKEAKHLQKVNDGLMKLCKQVLTKLMKHKMSWIFKKPVDAVAFGLHDYHQIIKRPMDLGTVKVNLTKNGYANPMEFASDVRLVFENAMLYNPRTDDVHKMADQLLTFFEELFRPIKENLPDVNHGNEFSGINELLRSSKMAGAHNHGNKFLGINAVDRSSKMVAHNHVSEFSGVNELDRSSKMAAHNQVKEFSAVDELDGSSWDDVQTPERSKKRKTSSSSGPIVPVVPPTSKKLNHSAASNPIMQPVVQSVPSPVRRTPSPMQVAEPPSPMQVAEPPSPMQVAEQAEPVKPSSTATRTVVPKLPKPRAKDVNKREMNMEEKQKLGLGLQSMPPEKMPQLLQIIRKRNDQLAQEGDEIELDIEALDTETLWELDRFVTNWKKHVSKTKRQALMVNSGQPVAAPSASADIDIDDAVPLSDNKMDGMKKSKKEAGEEDVDIGEEMPESSFPHVEIEKDDGVVAGEGGVTGHGNGAGNVSSSSSGSSSSSSGDSSSSSDSGSGSSSGSDSDADDAQS